ncbi:MAG: TerC/Alx family metal homeostasis membrane protein [Candidatus Gracilibacteria bacterium]|jgi:tellurite resistance protein TerC
MLTQVHLWIIFAVVIVGFLIFDLGFFDRKAHRIEPKPAFLQYLFWVSMAIGFGVLVLLSLGKEMFAQFMSAYLTEAMLSLDNLFVIMLIFSFFKLDEKYHHKVLFWGILGAVVFRGIFITAGSIIISQFHWVLYVFGVLLVYTGIKLFSDKKEEHVDFENGRVVRFARKFLRFTPSPHNGMFIAIENGKRYFTLLFMIMLLVETTDIVFAVDSIPATFSISQDPFIVFTSNIFAVMGLRALFFLIENVFHRFHHLQKGLAFILIFIGMKMLADIFGVHISSIASFVVILVALGCSLLLSVIFPKKI